MYDFGLFHCLQKRRFLLSLNLNFALQLGHFLPGGKHACAWRIQIRLPNFPCIYSSYVSRTFLPRVAE